MTNVRLNPYYTGIHLHKNYHYELSRKKSLNPYYTGIHLHVLRCKEKVLTFVLILIILEYIYIQPLAYLDSEATCLNPYYTGIHLHDVPMEEGKLYKFVLILIILEYIYIY